MEEEKGEGILELASPLHLLEVVVTYNSLACPSQFLVIILSELSCRKQNDSTVKFFIFFSSLIWETKTV